MRRWLRCLLSRHEALVIQLHPGSQAHPFLLTTTPPSPSQRRLAVIVLLALLAALALALPYARVPLERSEVLLPAYASAILVNEIITAALLLGLFAVHGGPAVCVLAGGYLFAGLLVIPWLLTFPGIPERLGLPEAGLQATAVIAAVRRLGFPAIVLVYAAMKDRETTSPTTGSPTTGSPPRWVIPATVLLAGALAAALTWLVLGSEGSLPRFMLDARNVAGPWQYVPAAALILYAAGLALLWHRLRCVLDLWLMVVLCTLVIETLQLSYLSSGLRLSVGWWAGRLYGLVSSAIVLIVLLSETISLQLRLARSMAAERQAREARLTAMEAFSATVAHEINQPLASMVTNADAGMRWLDRARPDLIEVRAALRRIVDDGHRAGDVVEGIRTLFRKGTQERRETDLNSLIDEALERSRAEAALAGITIETRLAPTLPLVMCSPLQMQQVICNLAANAIDSLTAITGHARILRVQSGLDRDGSVLVSVEDTGTGLEPEDVDRMFEPFFTTRSHGMGMGLMYCRTIVESHGGRLWATGNEPRGAVFHFTLPIANRREGENA